MNEYPFVLPIGLQTSDGQYQREGTMRLATALDEIEPMGDERVKRNESYYSLVLLARVVTRLGRFSPLTADILASLPARDFTYLRDIYASLNVAQTDHARLSSTAASELSLVQTELEQDIPNLLETDCPHCGARLELDLSELHR